jgi:putative two-component system response regulator
VDVKVLLVDDDDALREAVALALSLSTEPKFTSVEASSHAQALELFDSERPDVVLMDLQMPGTDGDETTRQLLARDPQCKVVAHTGQRDKRAITRMLVAGAYGYIVKGNPLEVPTRLRDAYLGQRPIDPSAMPGLLEAIIDLAREESERRHQLEETRHELEQSHAQAVLALAETLRSRDNETGSHVDRVVSFSVRVAHQLGLSDKQIEDVRYGAIFHDIGKLGVPDDILLGDSELTQEQRLVINEHPLTGERILRPVKWLHAAAQNVRGHHENWDGTGYPDQLAGELIPLGARIIRVCDTFDAMTCGRRYQKAMDKSDAINKIQSMAGHAFDPKVVSALLAVNAKEHL